jgi:hypothetical protein
MTADDDVNVLATLHFRELFGRAEVYQVPPHEGDNPRVAGAPSHLRGRNLFSPGATYEALDRRFAEGQVVKATKLSQEFDYAAFRERYGEDALPLFIVTESGALNVCTADKKPSPKPGQTLISLVDPLLATSGPGPHPAAETMEDDGGEGAEVVP